MPMDVSAYLQTQAEQAADDEVRDLWRQLDALYSKRLWHQLTLVLQKLVKRPEMAQGEQLINLYNNAIADFETKLNPLTLVEIGRSIVDSHSVLEDALAFIQKLETKVSQQTVGGGGRSAASYEAVAYAQIIRGTMHLNKSKDLKQTKVLIESVDELLQDVDGVGKVHREFYFLASQYHKIQGDHANYYKTSLYFLGCSELSERSDADNQSLAVHLSLAALLGQNIFNFGELLAHPILRFLESGANQWLVKLLHAFNRGDVQEFGALKSEWSSQPDLKANESVLYEKICLLALMEMTFERRSAATDRQLTFAEVSEKTGLATDKVELLMMKALSRTLIKGQIDQVQQLMHVTWVQPRVLDCKQLETLMAKINDWTGNIRTMENLIETNAAEILTN